MYNIFKETSTPVWLDTTANSTAANALCAKKILESKGLENFQVHSVASVSNALRQHLLFKKVFKKQYTKTITLYSSGHWSSFYPGVVGLIHMQSHIEEAKKLL